MSINVVNMLTGDNQYSINQREDGGIDVLCKCGKPIVISNEYGMFCEDMCGYEESKKAAEAMGPLIEEFAKECEKHCKDS